MAKQKPAPIVEPKYVQLEIPFQEDVKNDTVEEDKNYEKSNTEPEI